MERLQEKVREMQAVETQMNQIRRETVALDKLSAPLEEAIADRGFWPAVLEDLNERMPKAHIWITELSATSGGKPLGVSKARPDRTAPVATPPPTITPKARGGPSPSIEGPALDGIFVRGLYLFNPKQQEVVVDYFRNLVASPIFAVDPNNQSRVIKPTTPNNTEWAYPYELRLDLRKPVKLP